MLQHSVQINIKCRRVVVISVNKATDGLDTSKSDAMGGGYYSSMKPGSGKEKRTLQSVKTHFYVGSEVDSKFYI